MLSPYTPLPSNHRNRFGGSLGGPITPKIAGGKTFFFVNYEGLRYPNVGNYERPVPTDTMRAGVIFVPNSAGTYQPYNLNPNPVTVNGVTYQPATCPAGALRSARHRDQPHCLEDLDVHARAQRPVLCLQWR